MKRITIVLLLLAVAVCYAPYDENPEERTRQEQKQLQEQKIEEAKRREEKLREQEKAKEEERAEKEMARYKQNEQQQKTSQSASMSRTQLKQDAIENYQEIYSHQQELKYKSLELQGLVLQMEIELGKESNPTMKEAFENFIFERGNLLETLNATNERLALLLKNTQQGSGKSPLLSSSDIMKLQKDYANSLDGREIAEKIPSLEQNVQKLTKDLATQRTAAKKKPEVREFLMSHDFIADLDVFLPKDATAEEIQQKINSMDDRTKFDLRRKISDILSLVDNQMRIAKKNIQQTSLIQSLFDQLLQSIKNIMRLISRAPEEAVGPYLSQMLKGGAEFMEMANDTTSDVERNNINRQKEYDGLSQQRRVISQLQQFLTR